MTEARETVRISWTDGRNNRRTQAANQVIDAREFVGTPGYALLIVAANTHLSVSDIERYLQIVGVGRSRSWIQRRRWLFQPPGADNTKLPQADLDGNAARAIEIMRENPKLSLRQLVLLLKEHGIKRGREWVRENRCR